MAEPARTLSWRGALLVTAGGSLAALPALLFGESVVSQVTGLYHLAVGSNAYFQPTYGLLLYLVTPLVSLSAFSLFLLPGVLLTLALGQARRIEVLLLSSFGISIVLSIVLTMLAALLFGDHRSPWALLSLWLAFTGGSAAVLVYRANRGNVRWCRWSHGPGLRRLCWSVGALLLLVVLLLPKIFWENFNLDGIEAFEYGRSLSSNILPHWEIFEGVFGFYQNFWLFSYPNHWFITLLGPFEAAARLPFLMYIVLLFSVLVLLIEHGQDQRLSLKEELVLWLGLALYTVVQAYNTSFEPFYTDLAETAATDTLGLLLFLAAVYSLWSGRVYWFIAFALMTYFATPGGFLLVLLLAGFTLLARPPRWQWQLRLTVGVFVACFGIGLIHDHVYAPLAFGDAASQFSSTNLLRRLFPPTITEWVRFSALLFPSGLLPVVALFLARRSSDWRSWVLAGVALGYFGLLYLQVWSALHQFTPVMVLPLVVFWRLYLSWKPQVKQWVLPALAVTSVLLIALSMPRHFQVNLAIREFGQATEYRIGDYQQDNETSAAGSSSLSALLPDSYRLDYPNQPWGADEYSWIYYATREKPAGTEINYLVQGADEATPADFTLVSAADGYAVYVKDLQQWERDRAIDIPRVMVSPLYEPILRHTYQFFREYTEKARES